MDAARSRESAERDQLWASLRTLRAQIDEMLVADPPFTDRQLQLVKLLARIVLAELEYRADEDAED